MTLHLEGTVLLFKSFYNFSGGLSFRNYQRQIRKPKTPEKGTNKEKFLGLNLPGLSFPSNRIYIKIYSNLNFDAVELNGIFAYAHDLNASTILGKCLLLSL